jgi:hypothetical protein
MSGYGISEGVAALKELQAFWGWERTCSFCLVVVFDGRDCRLRVETKEVIGCY